MNKPKPFSIEPTDINEMSNNELQTCFNTLIEIYARLTYDRDIELFTDNCDIMITLDETGVKSILKLMYSIKKIVTERKKP